LDDANAPPFLDTLNAAGKLNSFGLGINWYLNPNMRVMANDVYNVGVRTAGAKQGQFNNYASGLRFQVDW